MSCIYLATEDSVSESVGICLIEEVLPTIHIERLPKRGNGYLFKKRQCFIQMSNHFPVLLITDLDSIACPVQLKEKWFGNDLPDNLIFRIAVREIESWLLADHEGIINFMGRRVAGQLAQSPDTVDHPKDYLLQIATRANRAIREDIVNTANNQVRVGIGYNPRICEFVESYWDPDRASLRSESLRRARQKMANALS